MSLLLWCLPSMVSFSLVVLFTFRESRDLMCSLLDSLLRLNAEKAADVQEKIAAVCEDWFIRELPEKEAVAPQTISFLMLQSLRDDAKIAGEDSPPLVFLGFLCAECFHSLQTSRECMP